LPHQLSRCSIYCALSVPRFNRNVQMPEFESSSPKVDATCAGLKFGLMKNTFLAISSAGPNRDFSKGTREQPLWDEHAAFIDQLVDAGFILMAGPLVDEGGSLLIRSEERRGGKV